MNDAIDNKRQVIRKLQTGSVYGRFSECGRSKFVMWRFAPLTANNAGIMNEFSGSVFEIKTEQGKVLHMAGDDQGIHLDVLNPRNPHDAIATVLDAKETIELVKGLLGALIGYSASISQADYNEICGRLERIRMQWEEERSDMQLAIGEWAGYFYRMGQAVDQLAASYPDEQTIVDDRPVSTSRLFHNALRDMVTTYQGLLYSMFEPGSLAEAAKKWTWQGGRGQSAGKTAR